jgi:NAD-reducing hydrogenase small subunit
MSFLDLDERLLDLAARMTLVFSPFMDVKEFPHDVDVTLVEGAVANHDHLEQIRIVRERTKVLVSFGDCAVNGNVTALRNPLGRAAAVLRRSYIETSTVTPQVPHHPPIVPRLLDKVGPLHGWVKVDLHLPGCPPHADLIYETLDALLQGRQPAYPHPLRFG